MYFDDLSDRRQEIVLLDLRERVAKGVALLDGYAPQWRNVIDKDKLDITSKENCILGQVFGDYFDGKLDLDIDREPGGKYGFDAYYYYYYGSWDEDTHVGQSLVRAEWLRHL